MTLKKIQGAFEKLDPQDVTWSLPEEATIPATTEGMEPGDSIIGQDRALDALKMGLECRGPGFNVFVCGITGSGRSTTVKRILDQLDLRCRLPQDLCYVNNFDSADHPTLVTLPRDTATKFRESTHEMLRILGDEIQRIVNSGGVREAVDACEVPLRSESEKRAEEFSLSIEKNGFSVVQLRGMEHGTDLAYRLKNRDITMEELPGEIRAGNISQEQEATIREQYARHREELVALIEGQQKLRREFNRAVQDIRRNAVALTISTETARLHGEFPHPGVKKWLDQVESSILEGLEIFQKPDSLPEGQEDPGPDMSIFDVNILLTGSDDACPLVMENNPTHSNLFGSQEKVPSGPGIYGTDFSRIKAGSLLKAQGGFLVMNAGDVLENQGVWNHLIRTLKRGELVIQAPDNPPAPGTPNLSPDPIQLDVKVVLLGSAGLRAVLFEQDPDFSRTFKIKAEFDTGADMDSDLLPRYLDVIVRIIRDDGLFDIDKAAIETLLRHAMRLGGRRGRVTTRFSLIADVLREAHWCAEQEGLNLISATHVRTAIQKDDHRGSLLEEKIGRMILDREIWIPTEGSTVGQANALTVISTGDHDFGKPARISCRTSVGKIGVINLEREVELSDSSHDKGVLIFTGFLRGRYADRHPLTFSASICFEQSHSYIDGDSASSAELCTLLSALGDLPLRQDLAITGAVDQFGAMGTVGGINEKVEGFYKTCVASGLTGTQGVVLPHCVLNDLVLDQDVLDAMAEGIFHIYPAGCIDEAMEFLTGVEAGRRLADNQWTPGSINDRVQSRIDDLWKLAKDDV